MYVDENIVRIKIREKSDSLIGASKHVSYLLHERSWCVNFLKTPDFMTLFIFSFIGFWILHISFEYRYSFISSLGWRNYAPTGCQTFRRNCYLNYDKKALFRLLKNWHCFWSQKVKISEILNRQQWLPLKTGRGREIIWSLNINNIRCLRILE